MEEIFFISEIPFGLKLHNDYLINTSQNISIKYFLYIWMTTTKILTSSNVGVCLRHVRTQLVMTI